MKIEKKQFGDLVLIYVNSISFQYWNVQIEFVTSQIYSWFSLISVNVLQIFCINL